jgi:hypothetical protein
MKPRAEVHVEILGGPNIYAPNLCGDLIQLGYSRDTAVDRAPDHGNRQGAAAKFHPRRRRAEFGRRGDLPGTTRQSRRHAADPGYAVRY